MENIVECLVEAGYFKARISTLSDFDKIIGDTLDLGQKIALTERLVMVCLVMNCPHQIEPHQIVGLDYANILPVLKWLVKRSFEIRQEHEAFNRLLALRHYHRVTNSIQSRKNQYYVVPVNHIKQLKTSTMDNVNLQQNKEEFKQLEGTFNLLDRLDKDFKSNRQVSFIKLPSVFRVDNRDLDAHKLQKSSTFDEEEEDEEEEDKDDQSKESRLNFILKDKNKKKDASVEMIEKQSLIDNNQLKDDETKSSKLIKEEEEEASSKLQTTLDVVKNDVDDKQTNEKQRLAELQLHKELDSELLATNQKILNLLKKLDSMPSQLEIDQYQRRYIELHQQLISKNRDIKKLYALFNSLDSIKHYLTKEINLLDSIMSNLDLTNNSPTNRNQFIKQFQDIIQKIQDVRDEVVAKLLIIRKKCDSLNAEYAAILNNTN